ncbi:prolyl oligopeptidase family serine peptidase [Microbacterium oleivorans]|uniref:prolyl oligopeptidase family serine peptidase n=1 Tax=Microbacterium oleivorans TaxID=273677 RepID=UPI002041B309|nr:prolyl oligopeptidase family serine peptidase [Microbacterium oleivorans]MCM3697425.1 prolyl oligopeptidase family serine peptidase [Microbacterium oleivorans]
MTTIAPYGSWISPLSAADASATAARYDGARFVGDEIWWGESLPDEGGRTAVRRVAADGTTVDVLPAPWNAGSRVHEYGGGSWTAADDGRLFFVEKTDQRVWMLRPGDDPVPLTPVDDRARHGGLRWQAGTLLAVREVHDGRPVPRRSLVAIPLDGAGPRELVAGSDFLAQPALSPDGRRLAWVSWNHPDMPWDRTEIRVGDVHDGVVSGWETVTSGETSALQPEWDAAGRLVYLDEPTGRWNLRQKDAAGSLALAPADADTGGGLWVLGTRWYAPLADGGTVAVRTNGADEVVRIDADGAVALVDVPARSRVVVEDVADSRTLVSGTGPGITGIWEIGEDGTVSLVRGTRSGLGDEWIPAVRRLTVPGPHGEVHAFDHPPTNPFFSAPEGELPPYLVLVHGGPTAHVGGVADSRITFFTSRGIGVLEVNYGGSTGYGRAYRERLRGQWGIVDRDDVAAAASGLAAERRADAARIAIAGGSAGGWTVLAALVGADVFSAGISRYGVGDARLLATDTHDFEARYLDGLIGPLPDAEALYRERSPLSHTDRFRVPVLLLQGAEDAVVPPSQAEAIRDALAGKGVPHAYVLYDGEGHGFRRAETVVHALESELAFLGQAFGFETPGVPAITLA